MTLQFFLIAWTGVWGQEGSHFHSPLIFLLYSFCFYSFSAISWSQVSVGSSSPCRVLDIWSVLQVPLPCRVTPADLLLNMFLLINVMMVWCFLSDLVSSYAIGMSLDLIFFFLLDFAWDPVALQVVFEAHKPWDKLRSSRSWVSSNEETQGHI